MDWAGALTTASQAKTLIDVGRALDHATFRMKVQRYCFDRGSIGGR
jgi:hypothetical protein